MSNTSQQTDYLTISASGLGYSTETITITSPSVDTIDLSSLSIGTIDLNNTMYTSGSTISNIGPLAVDDIQIFGFGEDWKDQFPNWDQVKDMCDKYPGLQIAFDKFKTVYKLVKDDYDAAKNSD